MYIATNGDGRIHFEEIGLAFQDLGARFDDEQSLFFGEAPFAVKVLFQELKVRLGAIMGRVELILDWRVEGGCLDVCSNARVSGGVPRCAGSSHLYRPALEC